MKIDYTNQYSNHITNIAHTNPCYSQFLVTKSFKPLPNKIRINKLNHITDHVFSENDRLYRHITSRLMTNFTRKPSLHPLAFHFFDLPNSQKMKSINFDNPELPHIHSIYLIHQETLSRFQRLAFIDKFQSITKHRNSITNQRTYPSLISIHAVEIEDLFDDLPDTVAYAAKLLDHSYSQHLMNDDCCFFTQNPKAAAKKPAHEIPRYMLLNESHKRMRDRLVVT